MDITDLLNPASISQNPTSAGIFCCVYRGQLYDGTAVAIKLRNPDDIWEMGRKSMPNLLAIWARCNHPNIVRLIGKTTFQGRLAAVYEWHEYGGIKQYLENRPTVDRCQLSVQICDAVTYLHANGIIHGDLEGDQILISNDGVARIPLSSEFASSWPFTHAAGGTFWLRWPVDLFQLSCGSRRSNSVLLYRHRKYAWDIGVRQPAMFMHLACNSFLNLSARRLASTGELPARPVDALPKSDAGNIIWDLLCQCWSFKPADRPDASRVSAVMRMVCQTPDDMVLRASKLVVKADTSVEDLVSHFEQHGLANYTERLHPNNIVSVTSIADTALANVYRVELLQEEPVAIKCPNVLVSDYGIIKVTDFGVSIMDHQEIEFSVTSSGRGTERWQAPEILLGSTDSTKEADVYALAVTMTEIYTGEQPYNELYWNQARQKVISGQLRPPRPIRLPIGAVGNGVWELLNYCWATNPNERPTSSEVDEWFQYYISFEIKS
ncbi:Fibroblast growth factor receptor 1 [Rhizoctonia solani]|uniref:Fibroblast growth factor receptor 1 n=1 Tax=Rhizoctonia solani TaxID=456999 RepID=A0A0K6FXY7_9AGAM|nr:Fibroblast growth factor receptor 1 [Rhizoctonia solani]